MRKPPAFCICENKGADQLCSNCTADQRLCFCYIDSTTPSTSYIRNFKPLAFFCSCTACFVSGLVRNPEDLFSQNKAQISTHVPMSFQYFLHSILKLESAFFYYICLGLQSNIHMGIYGHKSTLASCYLMF